MSCCGQNTTGSGVAPTADTGKRVNYVKGMLLGVDDFVQEQAWGIARRHELARELLGYGTVRGLQVRVDSDSAGPRVKVTPGMAWMPSGTPVCVNTEQCCDINSWLRAPANKSNVIAKLHGDPAPLTLHVVLSYAALATDNMPIPGEPCRSEDALMAASRIADCFRLELRLDPPEQREDDAIRDFADWLAKVPVDTLSPPMTSDDFLAQMRDAAHAWLSPGSPPPDDYMFGSPPAGLGTTDDLMRTALRLWVTELRPIWRARYGCGADPVQPGGLNDAVLLASLAMTVFPTQLEAQADVRVLEDTRPVLMSLRMLQELVTQNPAPEPSDSVYGPGTFGDTSDAGVLPTYSRSDHHHGLPQLPDLRGDVTGPIEATTVVALRGEALSEAAPTAGQALVYDGSKWSPQDWTVAAGTVVTEQVFGLPSTDGNASSYARSDHSHGTPTLQGDIESIDLGSPTEQHVRVSGLQGVPIDATVPEVRHVLTAVNLESGLAWAPMPIPAPDLQLIPSSVVVQKAFGQDSSDGFDDARFARADHSHGTPELIGDVVTVEVVGTQQTRVVQLQGRAISNDEPLPQQVLAFNGTSWAPTTAASAPTVPPLGGDITGSVPNATIQSLQRIPLNAAAPTVGAVLTFDGRSWVPGKGSSTVGNFVEREAGPFRLVAAGHARVTLTSAAAGRLAMLNSYSKLGGSVVPPRSRTGREVWLAFNASFAKTDSAKSGFIVKLTPVWTEVSDGNAIEFHPYLVDTVVEAGGAINFQVRLGLSAPAEKSQRYDLQVEVSRFAP